MRPGSTKKMTYNKKLLMYSVEGCHSIAKAPFLLSEKKASIFRYFHPPSFGNSDKADQKDNEYTPFQNPRKRAVSLPDHQTSLFQLCSVTVMRVCSSFSTSFICTNVSRASLSSAVSNFNLSSRSPSPKNRRSIFAQYNMSNAQLLLAA